MPLPPPAPRTPAVGARARASLRPGVSLLEIMITVTVVGIMVAIAMPSLRKSQNKSAIVSVREQILALGPRARVAARSNRGAALVHFTPDSVWLSIGAVGGGAQTQIAPRGIVFDPKTMKVELNPNAATIVTYDMRGVGTLAFASGTSSLPDGSSHIRFTTLPQNNNSVVDSLCISSTGVISRCGL